MAVDLINYQKIENHIQIHKSEGSDDVKSIEEQLVRILQSHNQQMQLESVDFVARESRKIVNPTGHARFRRGPSDPSTSYRSEPVKPVQLKSSPNTVEVKMKTKIVEEIKTVSTGISSGSSSISGEEGTVSNGNPLFANVVTPAPRTFSSGKPPLPTSHRKRCREIERSQDFSVKLSTSRGCHCCSKRRKTVVKTEIKRVTTTGSSKVAADDIPSDQYSWKKYDQKLIPGSHFPRGYYKCNSVKGCPARKHVERDNNDPTVLILTFEGEHRHHLSRSNNHRWMKMRMNSVAGVCF